MKTLSVCLQNMGIDVDMCGDVNYTGKTNSYIAIGSGGDSKQMIIDTVNIKNWYSFYAVFKHKKYDVVFYLSSHTLNLIAIVIARFFSNAKIYSHIHDPYPHGGAKYSFIILFSNKIQAKMSHKIIVYGECLKQMIVEGYHIDRDRVKVITHGVYRSEIQEYPIKKKKYISLLGRIESYKGVDLFLVAARLLSHDDDFKNVVFVIGGEGDLSSYRKLIERIPQQNILIKNKRLSDEEFDDILQKSYMLVLPYHDGTQTGNIQVAYYNACPVIVTNVGSLPELVVNGETGMVIEPGDHEAIVSSIRSIYHNVENIPYSKNAFEYYQKYLRWAKISNDLIADFKN
ncbi:glycosyltransferase family 4 protein [Prosthecochloris aestuarii]|nr:glycosyltransferase family 4 protein [Prosthecochloris aestuarii]